MSDELTTCEFHVNGEVVESVRHGSIPSVGERVEVGAMFDEDGRIDPSDADRWHDFDAEYRTVLSGVVTAVRRHYASAPGRNELTAHVEVDTEGEI